MLRPNEARGAVRSRDGAELGPEAVLGVRVVMVVMTAMVMASGENGASEHQKKQCGGENLFHAKNVARIVCPRKALRFRVSKEARACERAAIQNRRRSASLG